MDHIDSLKEKIDGLSYEIGKLIDQIETHFPKSATAADPGPVQK